MDSTVVGQLRVEAGAEHVVLAQGHDIASAALGVVDGPRVDSVARLCRRRCLLVGRMAAGQRGQDLDDAPVGGGGGVALFNDAVRQQLVHDGGADEDGREGRGIVAARRRQEGQRQVRDEALALPSEVIPMHAHGEPADELLPALLGRAGLLAQQDEPGAGAPRRFPSHSARATARQ